MDIVLNILAYILIDIIFGFILWIFALVLWGVCLPLSIIAVTPFFLISSIYADRLKSNYVRLFNFWINIGMKITP
jgi:hypothetical protein